MYYEYYYKQLDNLMIHKHDLIVLIPGNLSNLIKINIKLYSASCILNMAQRLPI